jgi:DNA-binding CsgD family transcriptional regulator
MEDNSKILHSVWDKSPDRITSNETEHKVSEFNKFITSLFCPGPHYYYIVDFFDRKIKQISDSAEQILGMPLDTITFDDVINSMHPEDMDFVVKAEEASYHYIYNILGKENILKYKVSYCFRSKTANGEYHLFNHQAIVLTVDSKYGFGRSLNIHTDINHLSQANNHKIYLIGIYDNKEMIEIKLNENIITNRSVSLFSKRESEIINLISLGYRTSTIAEMLFISLHTVKNHRKNIFKKANVKNCMELMKRCTNESLL